jgi:hypothetical protein
MNAYGDPYGPTQNIYFAKSDKSISGNSLDPRPPPILVPPVIICDDSAKIEQLLALIDSLYATIEKLFPLIRITAKETAKISAKSMVTPALYVRLMWIEQHKGVRFIGSLVQLLQLKDNYFVVGEDWTQDKMLVTRLPPAYQ